MTSFSKREAERALAELDMTAANRALCDHWLSLWPGDALPPRAAIAPARLKPYLPNIMLMDTVPDRSVTIRLAGTRIVSSLKTELTGQDWVALAPKSYRAKRLRNYSAVARGAVVVGHRRVPLTFEQYNVCEEILLPFAPDQNGIYPVLVHLDWKPLAYTEVESVPDALGAPTDTKIITLRKISARASAA